MHSVDLHRTGCTSCSSFPILDNAMLQDDGNTHPIQFQDFVDVLMQADDYGYNLTFWTTEAQTPLPGGWMPQL